MALDGDVHTRVAAATAIDTRLENWSRWLRVKLGLGEANSLEGRYRSKGAYHWELPPLTNRAAPDALDAFEVESAVALLDLFHHLFLKGHYVRLWHPDKVMQIAYRHGLGERAPRHPAYDSIFAMARALLTAELARPAVMRKPRARALADAILAREAEAASNDAAAL